MRERIAVPTPIRDRLLVKRLGPPVNRSGIIWIPDVAAENSKFAEVVAVGPKVRDIKPGDEILVPGAGFKYPDWEKSDYVMIQEADIGGTIERE